MNTEPIKSSAHRQKPNGRITTILLWGMGTVVFLLFTMGDQLTRPWKQQKAVAALRNLGATCGYETGGTFNTPWWRDVLGHDTVAKVSKVNLQNCQVTDADLVHLEGLPHVQILVLSGTNVSDRGMAYVQQLTQLEYIYLGRHEDNRRRAAPPKRLDETRMARSGQHASQRRRNGSSHRPPEPQVAEP